MIEVKERVKIPVRAGMRMEGGRIVDYAIKEVGYKVVEFTYRIHPDGDKELIGEKEVERVIGKPMKQKRHFKIEKI
jgi:acyl-CoA thioesterase FadM